MAKQNTNDNQKTKQKIGIFGLMFLPLTLGLKVLFYLTSAVLISVLIEWGGMITGIFDHRHAESVLIIELGYLGDNLPTTITGLSAEELGTRVVDFFKVSLVPTSSKPLAAGGEYFFVRWVNDIFANWPYYRNAFVFVLMVIGIRFVIIVLSSLLFVLVGVAAAVDGLHLRELRKLGGGIEHAGIYHRAKSLLPYTIWFAPVLYLAWPGAINPNFILLPGMSLFFTSVLISFATFKKYL